jgi:hypothetical protein
VSLYINGRLAGTRIDHFNLSRDQIGSWADAIPESPLAAMDEVMLYGRALSDAEIKAHVAAIPEPTAVAIATLGMAAFCSASRARRFR